MTPASMAYRDILMDLYYEKPLYKFKWTERGVNCSYFVRDPALRKYLWAVFI